MRIQHTTILSRYIFKFIIRLVIFGGIFALYLTGKDNFMEFFNMQLLPLPAFMGAGITVLYDWGHFMMFTPMLFIRNFYSWSLFFTSFLVLLKWEMTYAKHPERFWEGSNKVLKCSNCKDKSCQFKKALKADARG